MSQSELLYDREQYRTPENLQARAALHLRFSTASQGWYDWLLDRIPVPAGGRVLDVGCGAGGIWEACKQRLPQGIEVVLADVSQGMVEKATATTGFSGVVADAQTLPFDDERFDVVVAAHMLYHLDDLPEALAELRRVLSKEGCLVAATNGVGHMSDLDRLSGEEEIRLPFSLENGCDLLAQEFREVRLERYEDALHVTDEGAAIAYLRSYRDLNPEREVLARQEVVRAIRAEGCFRVAKSQGCIRGFGLLQSVAVKARLM